jgi:hypothetical protein
LNVFEGVISTSKTGGGRWNFDVYSLMIETGVFCSGEKGRKGRWW